MSINSWKYKAFCMKTYSILFSLHFCIIITPNVRLCIPPVIVILFSAERSGSRLSPRMPPCLSTLVDFCWSKQFWHPCLPLQRECRGVSCSVYKWCGQTTLRAFSSFSFCVCAAATQWDFGSLYLHWGKSVGQGEHTVPSSAFSGRFLLYVETVRHVICVPILVYVVKFRC